MFIILTKNIHDSQNAVQPLLQKIDQPNRSALLAWNNRVNAEEFISTNLSQKSNFVIKEVSEEYFESLKNKFHPDIELVLKIVD